MTTKKMEFFFLPSTLPKTRGRKKTLEFFFSQL